MASHDPVLVVGGGIAGLATALHLAPLPVLLLTAGSPGQGAATALAQGGIAAAIGADDEPRLHAADTLAAGAGLVDPLVAHRVAAAAPGAIADLVRWGVAFDQDEQGRPALGLEAAHQRRRILHAGGDATGRVVLAAMLAQASRTPSIEIRTHAQATDLLRDAHGRVCGVRVVQDGQATDLAGRAVVLATGGIGGLFATTTNPLSAIGGGLAMAARIGAVMRDLEFVQFHPTAMLLGLDPAPLASEAIRGEGAWLVDEAGRRFMADLPGAELAPRDVVARAIATEIARGHRTFLDARYALGTRFAQRFPEAAAACRRAGIDPATDPIPVMPAAHYHMGGIAVDAAGRSSVPGLWAVGEVAATGLHGANRLASNSLLEGLACGRWAARDIAGLEAVLARPEPPKDPTPLSPPSPALVAELRWLMTRQVGVVRDAAGLADAVARLGACGDRSGRALVCRMIAEAALARAQSVGSHHRQDLAGAERLPAAA
ncbi:L-aspartate oxidase [Geminicoccus roseus]|uniref:L-aspartate oxidase n=1 Tax=Geminicoccus roseus TaxID=404900 RepID=UPI00042A8F43|nr:L-aspartate oxidase [Geminicoccus roseus]